METFSATFRGQKVYGKWIDSSRPTCGNVYTSGYGFELVTLSDLDDCQSHESLSQAIGACQC